jgi:hypothetical protein
MRVEHEISRGIFEEDSVGRGLDPAYRELTRNAGRTAQKATQKAGSLLASARLHLLGEIAKRPAQHPDQ